MLCALVGIPINGLTFVIVPKDQGPIVSLLSSVILIDPSISFVFVFHRRGIQHAQDMQMSFRAPRD